MTRHMRILMVAGVVAVLGGAGIAAAQNDDGIVAAARAGGDVGEQADGYLGFVTAPSGPVKSAVDAVNIKRRAIYTDIAAKQNATVQEVAAARGCDQLARRVAPGQKYRTGGGWQTRGAGAIDLPAVCG